MLKPALVDLLQALKRSDLWLHLGWHDIRQRYRRSSLGPFWITLSTLILVSAMTLVYGALFRQEIKTFLPIVAIGIVIWSYISGCITEGSTVFINASPTIKQIPAPLPVHLFRMMWNQLIYLMHNAAIVLLALVVSGRHFSATTLLVLPALAILTINLGWMAWLLGTISARYRDVPLIIQSFITGLFMVTPVLWQISFLPADRQWVAYINPITYLIEIIRLPLLGIAPSVTLWGAVSLMAGVGWLAAAFVYGHARKYISYWI